MKSYRASSRTTADTTRKSRGAFRPRHPPAWSNDRMRLGKYSSAHINPFTSIVVKRKKGKKNDGEVGKRLSGMLCAAQVYVRSLIGDTNSAFGVSLSWTITKYSILKWSKGLLFKSKCLLWLQYIIRYEIKKLKIWDIKLFVYEFICLIKFTMIWKNMQIRFLPVDFKINFNKIRI